jgi:hypothetical protein
MYVTVIPSVLKPCDSSCDSVSARRPSSWLVDLRTTQGLVSDLPPLRVQKQHDDKDNGMAEIMKKAMIYSDDLTIRFVSVHVIKLAVATSTSCA